MGISDNLTKIICPYCSSDSTVKSGWVYRLAGKRQRYLCKNCRHNFGAWTPRKVTA